MRRHRCDDHVKAAQDPVKPGQDVQSGSSTSAVCAPMLRRLGTAPARCPASPSRSGAGRSPKKWSPSTPSRPTAPTDHPAPTCVAGPRSACLARHRPPIRSPRRSDGEMLTPTRDIAVASSALTDASRSLRSVAGFAAAQTFTSEAAETRSVRSWRACSLWLHTSRRSAATGVPRTTRPSSWREANDTAARIGGWRAYVREAQQPDPAASAPAATPAQLATIAMPMPQGHGGHKMP